MRLVERPEPQAARLASLSGASPEVAADAQTYAELEARVLAGGMEGIALRYGFYYGPGTWFRPRRGVRRQGRRQEFPIIGADSGVWSWVHVEEVALATVEITWRQGETVYTSVWQPSRHPGRLLGTWASVSWSGLPGCVLARSAAPATRAMTGAHTWDGHRPCRRPGPATSAATMPANRARDGPGVDDGDFDTGYCLREEFAELPRWKRSAPGWLAMAWRSSSRGSASWRSHGVRGRGISPFVAHSPLMAGSTGS